MVFAKWDKQHQQQALLDLYMSVSGWQSETASFWENYAKLYYEEKIESGVAKFLVPFFFLQKKWYSYKGKKNDIFSDYVCL